MPRAKKNPITELPTVEPQEFPIQHEPGSHEGIFDGIADGTKSNVVPIRPTDTPADQSRDWGDIDAILSNVVNFV